MTTMQTTIQQLLTLVNEIVQMKPLHPPDNDKSTATANTKLRKSKPSHGINNSYTTTSSKRAFISEALVVYDDSQMNISDDEFFEGDETTTTITAVPPDTRPSKRTNNQNTPTKLPPHQDNEKLSRIDESTTSAHPDMEFSTIDGSALVELENELSKNLFQQPHSNATSEIPWSSVEKRKTSKSPTKSINDDQESSQSSDDSDSIHTPDRKPTGNNTPNRHRNKYSSSPRSPGWENTAAGRAGRPGRGLLTGRGRGRSRRQATEINFSRTNSVYVPTDQNPADVPLPIDNEGDKITGSPRRNYYEPIADKPQSPPQKQEESLDFDQARRDHE